MPGRKRKVDHGVVGTFTAKITLRTPSGTEAKDVRVPEANVIESRVSQALGGLGVDFTVRAERTDK